jgi:hypothetical protein
MNPIKYFVVYGNVRGFLSKHKLEKYAHKACEKDHISCKSLPGGNSYSDTKVYAIHKNGDRTGPYFKTFDF